MFYLGLLCIFVLAAVGLPALGQAITSRREQQRAPPPRGFRPVVIQGGKQDNRAAS
jgi:hypothetical protein